MGHNGNERLPRFSHLPLVSHSQHLGQVSAVAALGSRESTKSCVRCLLSEGRLGPEAGAALCHAWATLHSCSGCALHTPGTATHVGVTAPPGGRWCSLRSRTGTACTDSLPRKLGAASRAWPCAGMRWQDSPPSQGLRGVCTSPFLGPGAPCLTPQKGRRRRDRVRDLEMGREMVLGHHGRASGIA